MELELSYELSYPLNLQYLYISVFQKTHLPVKLKFRGTKLQQTKKIDLFLKAWSYTLANKTDLYWSFYAFSRT